MMSKGETMSRKITQICILCYSKKGNQMITVIILAKLQSSVSIFLFSIHVGEANNNNNE